MKNDALYIKQVRIVMMQNNNNSNNRLLSNKEKLLIVSPVDLSRVFLVHTYNNKYHYCYIVTIGRVHARR